MLKGLYTTLSGRKKSDYDGESSREKHEEGAMAKTNGNATGSIFSEQSSASQPLRDSTLPLFFQSPAALDPARHDSAGLLPDDDVRFAAATNSIYINSVEFAEAAKHYPIVFSIGDNPMPVVITGLENVNYFVGDDHRWRKDAYVPAYVRRYPFVFMEVPEQDKFVLCVDESAKQFRREQGEGVRPFFVDDKPSELSLNALEFCRAFQQEFVATREFSKRVQEAGLLSPSRSDVKLNNSGRDIQLAGFQVIDQEKFNQLSDEQILEFHKKGWLPLVYFMLLSSSNWRNLVTLAAEVEM